MGELKWSITKSTWYEKTKIFFINIVESSSKNRCHYSTVSSTNTFKKSNSDSTCFLFKSIFIQSFDPGNKSIGEKSHSGIQSYWQHSEWLRRRFSPLNKSVVLGRSWTGSRTCFNTKESDSIFSIPSLAKTDWMLMLKEAIARIIP